MGFFLSGFEETGAQKRFSRPCIFCLYQALDLGDCIFSRDILLSCLYLCSSGSGIMISRASKQASKRFSLSMHC